MSLSLSDVWGTNVGDAGNRVDGARTLKTRTGEPQPQAQRAGDPPSLSHPGGGPVTFLALLKPRSLPERTFAFPRARPLFAQRLGGGQTKELEHPVSRSCGPGRRGGRDPGGELAGGTLLSSQRAQLSAKRKRAEKFYSRI